MKMNKKTLITISFAFVLGIIISIVSLTGGNDAKKETGKLTGTVMGFVDDVVTIEDENSVTYTCNATEMNFNVGDNVTIEYSGILNENSVIKDCEVLDYEIVSNVVNPTDTGIPTGWQDNGIFKDFYVQAYNKLQTLTLDEKIGQLLLVRYPDSNQVNTLSKYGFGGYVFFAKDFENKTTDEVKNMTSSLQKAYKIPILTAVDEEGGKVVRISSNSKLVPNKFRSPSDLYKDGGFVKIKEDTVEKSRILNNLGINVNLAPVVDVSTNPSDYMYDRTLQENTNLTSTYAKTVIEASKGTGVSYTLKHFPGYGNNPDTHTGSTTDNRSYDDIMKNDIPPFEAGIESGAEAVLVSHNTVTNIDSSNPASLSPAVHTLLRNNLKFTGVIITDDIAMGATNGIDNATVKAILAGNDLVITTDYEKSINSVKTAVNNGTLSENQIDKAAFRVLAWKYYKMILAENEK